MRTIDMIVLHHTAGRQGGERIRRDHIRRGWRDIFYHFVIEPDGKIFIGRDLGRPSGKRRTAIEIAVVGKLHLENMTEKQNISLVGLINALKIEFPYISKFYNHKDLAATICPGNIDIKNFLSEEVTNVKDLILRISELEDRNNELHTRLFTLENKMRDLFSWREDLRAFVHGVIMPEVRYVEMLESQIADLVSWREDLRAFVHGVIMPEVRYVQGLRNSEVPVRGEGTE